jgi:hypothetical protein
VSSTGSSEKCSDSVDRWDEQVFLHL